MSVQSCPPVGGYDSGPAFNTNRAQGNGAERKSCAGQKLFRQFTAVPEATICGTQHSGKKSLLCVNLNNT
jgi:hypothetical protein